MDNFNSELLPLYDEASFVSEASNILNAPHDRLYLLSVAIEDLDMLDELYGISVSEAISERTASILTDYFIGKIPMTRMNNGRFAILMDSDQICQNDILNFLNGFHEASSPYRISIHIGIASANSSDRDFDSLLKKATIAVDNDLNKSGNSYSVYSDDLLNEHENRKRVLHEVEDALDGEQFLIFFQPFFDGSGNILGAESLVRWVHPTDGVLTPCSFISILEEENLIYIVDRYVWELVMSQLADWKKTPFADFFLAVNISEKDFFYLDIYSILTELAGSYDIDPSKLVLEITEDTYSYEANRHTVDKLKQFGFKIAIDNFGGSHSSFMGMKNIHADFIKIDTGFIRALSEDSKNRIILSAVIDVCKGFDIKVAAEGIETEEQLGFLKEKNIYSYQGYYFDKPMLLEEMEAKYADVV